MPEWENAKVLVLGLGDTGWSMARWLSRQGARVTVADTRETPPRAEALRQALPKVRLKTGALRKSMFSGMDAVAISPGIDRRDPAIADAIKRRIPVVGDVELFARALKTLPRRKGRAAPHVVAITGSNGKSTVTAMTGEISKAAGRSTVVAGNIGLPVLDALEEVQEKGAAPDVFVLELSSFQLESTALLDPDAATVLNISADHLDRYDGIESYAAAKARIFAGKGVQVLNRDDATTLAMARRGRSVKTFGLTPPRGDGEWGVVEVNGEPTLAHGDEPLMPVRELPLTGMHNAANALAALALGDSIWLPSAPGVEALRRFSGLPHRVEHVADVKGIGFYDDSKGTNVGATVAALNGMPRRVVLIAGGDGKGQNFAPLAEPVRAHARAVVLIGRDADEIAIAIEKAAVPLIFAKDMNDAVERAYGAAQRHDAVLLSPACASYDMFRNYIHRGELFTECVKKLAEREEKRG